MDYKINVARLETTQQFMKARQYIHFFATDKKSCHNLQHAAEVFQKLIQAFPSPEYNITVTKWTTSGEKISFEELAGALESA